MVTRVDRIQVAVPERRAAGDRWVSLLGAEHEGEGKVEALRAVRSTYRLGDGCVEFLEPDGAGPLMDALARRGPHLFAGGVAAPDVDAVVDRLRSKGLDPAVEGGQVHMSAGGVPLVVSAASDRPTVGLVDFIYEITDLRHDAAAWASRYADLFGIDESQFVPITSPEYGYTGTLTLFDHSRLDRLEVITPMDPEKTMGRFFARYGEVLYMCYVESSRTSEIFGRAKDQGAPLTGDRSGLFLHPAALGGVMLGVSRRTAAWRWSGHPERVERA